MKITGSVHYLKIPFTIPLPDGRSLDRFVNVYLVYGKKILLIDSGVAGSGKFIFDYINHTGRTPDEISGLILTHSHPDHIGGASEIVRETGCDAYIHSAEKNWAEDTALQNRERTVPGFDILVGGPVKITRTLSDGDEIFADNGTPVKVIYTPGHSEGSVSLAFESERVLFTGDAVPVPGDLPIFDKWGKAYRSVVKLKEYDIAETLLSAWDTPAIGKNDISKSLANGMDYLDKIRETVLSVYASGKYSDPMELCRKTLAGIGIPETAANPIVSRSFMAVVNEFGK